MGVEYKRLLIPEERELAPSAGAVARLVDELREQRWIPDPSSEAFHHARGGVPLGAAGWCRSRKKPATRDRPARIVWERTRSAVTVEELEARPGPKVLTWWLSGDPTGAVAVGGLRYPLTAMPDVSPVDYEIELRWAADAWFTPFGFECIEPLATGCRCGAELADAEGETVRARCPRCGRAWDPLAQRATIASQLDGTRAAAVAGGVAHRFGITVDCGKCFAHEEERLVFQPALRRLVEAELGARFVEIGVVY